MAKKEISGDIKKDVYRPVLKVINRTQDALSNLDRDFSISEIAWMDVGGLFEQYQLSDFRSDIMKIMDKLNRYRRIYWKLQQRLSQGFLSYMKKAGYLPSSSPEINSLKTNLSDMMIKGDGTVWIYSYDYYIRKISDMVGRSPDGAPSGRVTWDHFDKWSRRDVDRIVKSANEIMPAIHRFKARIQMAIRHPERKWSDLHVKTPKVNMVSRPIRKLVIVKKPLPLDKNVKPPRKRILKKPKWEIIGPEDGI